MPPPVGFKVTVRVQTFWVKAAVIVSAPLIVAVVDARARESSFRFTLGSLVFVTFSIELNCA